MSDLGLTSDLSFYPRARGGGDSGNLNFSFYGLVSIHAPAGGATKITLLRFGRVHTVSIHAPAGGATVVQSNATDYVTVSIHAPAGGATLLVICSSILRRRFYPRARGGRDERKTKELQDCLVSIHAPAGGATKSLTVSLLPY